MDSNLSATPHVGGSDIHNHVEISFDRLSLNETRSVIWRDVIFVNLSGSASEFDHVAADLRTRWAEIETPLYFSGQDSLFLLTIDCNWKLAIENYCEFYHLPFIHPGLNSYSCL